MKPKEFPEIEKKVLELYLGANMNLRDIALKIGVSRERARQIRQKAMRRLKINSKLTGNLPQFNTDKP